MPHQLIVLKRGSLLSLYRCLRFYKAREREEKIRERERVSMTTERFFEEVELPDLQKSDNGVVFPAVLFPNPKINDSCQLSHLNKAIEAHKPWLESLLHKTGALLLRGFPVTTASDFNDVVEAFGFPDMPYIGGGAVRSQVVGRVFTANESPPDQRIHFHNEMAYASDFPNKLFFFCEVEPRSGGETAIVQGHVLYDRMKEKYPEFVQELEEHGLIYARLMPEEDDNSHQIGRGWKSTFSTSDKSVAEQRAANLGMKMEWLENVLILKTEPRLAIKFDQVKQSKTWFNSLAVVYESSKGVKNVNVDKLITFGNGKSLPAPIVHDCLKIMDEESVAIPWEKGDILLIDNLTVLHSRLPLISPPRRVLASICK